ncbi:FtsX-like permease family protein [Vagococcus coleopterorum]|uniref:FtsX-like permease family protein n=1 Tax=Vagococcus coleopterorum TaxID=2714946 RepID=A0A6G8APD1_9ENTE|nr:ABC transporter permease [Vagococcus coleopterorum]QIL46938.1 FtsX-like permease family protein [Vagococcus coleopterorum]
MKKRALYKSILRELKQSKARFFSILGIILLGVSFYAGIKATGPNMLKTAENYYVEQQLMDQRIMSPLGLTKDDLAEVKGLEAVDQVEAVYSKDISLADVNRVIRFMSYDKKDRLNRPVVNEGRLPQSKNEIVLDQLAKDLEDYQIGDKVDIPSEDGEGLSEMSFEVVGFVNSPMFIEKMGRGTSAVGKGSVDYFALIGKECFTEDIYSDIYLTYKNTKDLKAYSDDYKEAQEKSEKQLKAVLANREDRRLAEVRSQLEKGQTELAPSKQQIELAEIQIQQAKNQLEQLKQVPGLDSTTAEKEFLDSESTFNKQKADLEQAEKSLIDQEKGLAKLADSDVYYYLTRDDSPGYTEYQENAKRLSSIATVFPVFFFLIAALVCLTTMTRMVDEKRGEIGTLKALGYSNFDISLKYIIYAILASLIGSGLGLLIGYHVFPKIIIDAYGNLYNTPSAEVSYYWSYTLQSVIVALLCTVLSALVVLRYDLFSSPATLMRPKAPKAGKRIWLERLPFIWKGLNFNQKVTARNLFRYKQRMFMTVFGIAGCMALMITGFGIKDSISDVVDLQFNKIWHYQGVVAFDSEADQSADEDYQAALDKLPKASKTLSVAQSNFDVSVKGKAPQAVTLNTPEQLEGLSDFILFNDRQSGKKYQLTDDGAVINEKLAKLFDLKVGDDLPLKDNNGVIKTAKIAAVVENYAMHFAYVTPTYYEEVFGEKPTPNSQLLLLKDKPSEEEEERISEELMATDKVINVTFLSETSRAMDDTISSLNVVVWVLIISAALLAFIVLYNLTNINISERIRELSTIKVLGFYNREVTMYVYRENNILTVLGIIVGCFIGKFLHGFVLATAEVDMLMFSPTIHGVSYVYAAILTVFFSLVVMFFMHRKLKKVDMIEALKSNE